MITENVAYSSFHSNHCKGSKFFYDNHAAYQSKLSLKHWSQTDDDYLKILLQRLMFYPNDKNADLSDGVKKH